MSTPDAQNSYSLKEIQYISAQLAKNVIQNVHKTAPMLGIQITLLEIFKFERKRFESLGYCDLAMASVAHQANKLILQHLSNSGSKAMRSIVESVQDSIASNEEKYLEMERKLVSVSRKSESASEDPLLMRFANLKTGSSETPVASKFEGFLYSDSVSVYELNHLIRSRPNEVLLIDFRTKKEFNYSHINFSNIINIEPSKFHALIDSQPKMTIEQLGEALRLDPESLRLFRNMHQFGLIVAYVVRFGGIGNDKFQGLEFSLLNEEEGGIPSKNPFKALFDIIMFSHEQLVHRPKQYPVYLNGGLERWYSTFGEGSLTSTKAQSTPSAQANGKSSNGSSSSSTSAYVRNFSDYLASAKSSPSPTIPTISSVSSSVSNNDKKTDLGYRRPARLDPPPPYEYSKSSKTASPPKNHVVPSITKPEVPVQKSEQRASVQQLTPKSTSPSEKAVKEESNAFFDSFATGLTNLGNSCYMNCVLQCLGATPQITSFFFAPPKDGANNGPSYQPYINTKNNLGTNGVLTTNFVKLLANMFNNVGKYFAPHDFKKVIGTVPSGRQFASFDQQDCIEFLNFVLDSLHEDLNDRAADKGEDVSAHLELTPEQEEARERLPVRLASTIEWERYLKFNLSVIVDYFQGQYLSQLKCLECGMTSTTYNAFTILSLPIPERLNKDKVVTLSQCLDQFTELELLDDDNKWHCPRCKRFTRSTKKISITRLPRVLIIHFKRFQMSMTGRFNKLETFVTYPVNETLDLTRYWPQVGTYINSQVEPQMSVEEELQFMSRMKPRHQQPPFRYKLYGVINHYGNLTTGHYTTFVKKASNSRQRKEWCYFDDAKISYDCKVDQVMNKSAYCLFFKRV